MILIQVGHGLEMNIIVPVYFTISVHDDDIFMRAFENTLKLFVTFNRLSSFCELVLKGQVLFGFQLLEEIFHVSNHIGKGIIFVTVHCLFIISQIE